MEAGDPEDEEAPLKPRKARGIIGETWALAGRLESDCTGGYSQRFAYFLKADGTLGNRGRSDCIPDHGVQQLIEHVQKIVAGLGARIRNGDVRILPSLYRGHSPCPQCAFRSACRFERGINGYRRIDAAGLMPRVLEITGQGEEKPAGEEDS